MASKKETKGVDKSGLVKAILPVAENEQAHTKLHRAIAEKNLKEVNKALRDGKVDVNQCHPNTEFGYPLIRAFEGGGERIVRALLEAGANPNVDNLLAFCVEDNNLPLAQLLIEFGAKPDGFPTWEKDDFFETNLIRAARRGHYTFAKLLLESGANPNAHDADDESALFIAMKEGKKQLAELLTGYASAEERAWVEEIVVPGYQEACRLDEELDDAIHAGQADRVLELLERSGRPLGDLLRPESGSLLEEALNAYFVALNISNGKRQEACLDAARGRYKPDHYDPEVVVMRKQIDVLLDLGVPVAAARWIAPLSQLPGLTGCPEEFELGLKMIKAAPDVNVSITPKKSTALFQAVGPGSFGYSTVFVKALLERGADPNARDCNNKSVLQSAREFEVIRGPNPSVPLLLEAGAEE